MYLTLCLTCKDEGSYLPEWLEYYFMMGVEHVYVYDNRSFHPLDGVLKPWLEKKLVTLTPYPAMDSNRQMRLYWECIRDHGDDSQWMGFIDLDEFLVIKTGQSIPDFLKRYEEFGGIGFFWSCFGSNGHLTRPPNQIESYTKRSHNNFNPNHHVKTFVQCQHVKRGPSNDPHSFQYRNGYYAVDENCTPMNGPHPELRTSELAQLNHYLLRSKEEFDHKIHRGGGNSWYRDQKFFTTYDAECNAVEDRTLLDILDGRGWKIPSFDPQEYKLETSGPPGRTFETKH